MAETATPRLVVTDASGRRTIPVDKPVVSLGRRSATDVHINDAGVSRLHAEIVNADGVALLRDCASRFGTFVNGERVDERALAHGDHIRLGDSQTTDIVFLVGSEGASQEESAAMAVSGLRQMGALLEALRALGSGRVLDDVLRLVIDAAIEVTGAERGFIMLANPKRELEFTMGRGRGRIGLSGQFFATSRQIPERVFMTGKTVIVEDLQDGQLAAGHVGTIALGIRYVLCAPLRLVRYVEREQAAQGSEMIGVLYLDSRERGALGSAGSRSALEMLSAEAAVAIENARLYREALDKAKLEQELHVAADIQKALLPPPSHAGAFFECAAASVACRAVGGDFFDYVDLPDGAFAFILGDVAGKGSPAALLASAVAGMFGAEAFRHTSPAGLVAGLNRTIFRRRVEGRFLTGFYGVVHEDGRFSYCNAGHNPPMLVTAGGICRLETGGTVLGLFEHAVYDEETLALAPGDSIVVFSDGVSEAMNVEGEEFGDDRLAACLEAARGRTPQEILETVQRAIREFIGEAVPSDDVTVLVVRYRPQ